MGAAMEVLTGFATAPGVAAFVAAAPAAGDSFTIRATPPDAQVSLIQAWMDLQGAAGAGGFRIRSPRLHDNVQGIRVDVVASELDPAIPWGVEQHLMPQDTLVVEVQGSATAGDIETVCLLLYYDNVPGVDAHLITWDEVKARMRNMVTIENTLALGVAGGYSGSEAINAETDLLKANTEYALIGYTVTVECAAVCWRGVDTGNLRVGGPGNELDHQVTVDWFKRLSIESGRPTIPVFNSANKAAIFIDGVQDENGADPLVVHYYAELG